MFDKRLLQLVPGLGRLIAGKVLMLWLTLLSNIAFAVTLVLMLSDLLVAADGKGPIPAVCMVNHGNGGCVPLGRLDALASLSHTMAWPPARIGAYAVAFAVILLVRYLATKGANHLGFLAAERVKLALRTKLYRRMLALGPGYANTVRTADVVQLAGEGVEQVQTFFELFLPQLFYSVLAPITLFVVVLPINVPAAVTLLVCAPLIVLIVGAVAMSAARVFKKYWGKYTDLGAEFLDDLQGLETLKIFDADERAHTRMNRRAEEFRVMTMNVLQIQLRSLTAMDLVAYGGTAAGIIVAVTQYLHPGANGLSLAGCVLIVLLSADFFIPLRQLGSYFHVAMNGMTSSRKIFALLDLPEPAHGDRPIPKIPDDGVAIELTDVSYRYDDHAGNNPAGKEPSPVGNEPTGTQALHAASFAVPPHRLTAIVGVSGSGKSTAAGILAGRLPGYDGSVTFRLGSTRTDDARTGDAHTDPAPTAIELRDCATDSLLREVTIVSASSHLFHATVRENLLMARPDATDADLWEALDRAHIADWVREQPQGLDLMIDEGAANLSGGQKQRLALARGLLHDSAIYIFDEATSNVDAESETLILDAIRTLAARKTVLMITHRMANAVNADQVVVFDNGTVTETGTHDELMATDGRYAELFRTQNAVETFDGRSSVSAAVTSSASTVAESTSGESPTVETLDLHGGHRDHDDHADRSDRMVRAAHTADRADHADHTDRTDHTDQSSPRPSSTGALILRLLGVARPLTRFMVCATVFGTIGHLSATFLPVFGVFALLAVAGHPVWGIGLPAAVAGLVVCALLRGIMRYTEQYMNHNVAFRLLALFRDRAFAALRRLAPARLSDRGKGDLIALITTDVELLEIFFAHTISPVSIAVITSLVFAVALAALNPWMALVLIAAHLTVGVLVPKLFAGSVSGIGPRIRRQSAELDDYVLDGMRGIDETIRFAQGPTRIEEIARRTRELTEVRSKLSAVNGRFAGIGGLLVQLFTILAAVVAILCAMPDPLGVPASIAAVVLIASSFGPTLALSALPANLTQTFAAARRLFSLMDETPAVEETGTADAAYRGMALDHVGFSYGERGRAGDRAGREENDRPGDDRTGNASDLVLDDVSLEVPERGVLGIQGPSGTGKSTILKLLMRYWDPQEGRVIVRGGGDEDGRSKEIDLRRIDPHRRRRMQTMVAQETYLFDGSIRENLLVADPDADDERLRTALERASVAEFVDSLPQGLDTPVGELGDRLSEGERQRIGLARVFLRDADLVLFDEPTSRLDALNEAIILRSIAGLAMSPVNGDGGDEADAGGADTADAPDRGRHAPAVVMVSHRQSAMRIADRIIAAR
ncbi:ATP-binding cassette domain-containing protein [Bifidobacterium simiarum]|uniref:ABC transporter ATP-binding protein n=1 Tax=Bifidobacterium simiarum TaxID=2045441 RepID=A0A2M9HDH4_9BIFI|nr:ATP-binding cassette domain-containing protein [Bifidobacterium simiarum]PJM74862.1 ABC transporter ATP-binding protein [Bifidobacterium simiarum]